MVNCSHYKVLSVDVSSVLVIIAFLPCPYKIVKIVQPHAADD